MLLQQHGTFSYSKSDDLYFSLLFVHGEGEESTLLYSYIYRHKSIVVAREMARRSKEHLFESNVLVKLWADALAKQSGFKVDHSKGLDYFFEEVAKRSSTELLNAYAVEVEYEPYKTAVENELKSRGEIDNDRNN